jgi:hypothetical protein
LPASPAGRFPGAVLAIRAARTSAVHSEDGLYVYLPPSVVSPGDMLTYFIADDGSAYTSSNFTTASLARSSEGQIYPARSAAPSTVPAQTFTRLNRRPSAMALTDATRFGTDSVLVKAALFTGPSTFQALGGIATVDQVPGVDPDLQTPNPWPAYSFAPSKNSVDGNMPEQGLLSILLRPLSGDFIPSAELVLTNRSGQSLLIYLPEISQATGEAKLLVANDGSTYFASTDAAAQQSVLQQQSLSGLALARAAQGQVLAIPGLWPLQQRSPVALNLCRNERASLLTVGELGIDPELGRFALPPGDPAVVSPPSHLAFDRNSLSVEFVEAFTDFVGALNSDQRDTAPGNATRFVSRSGDVDDVTADNLTGAPVHANVSEAVAAARDGDVIEIADSATYDFPAGIVLPASLKNLYIRAASGQRPCLTSYQSAGVPSNASFVVNSPMALLELNGLLVSGGPLAINNAITQLQLTACTFDPSNPTIPSIVTSDADLNSEAGYVISRCITGGMWLGRGVSQLTLADSIVDQQGRVAIAGAARIASSPVFTTTTTAARSVQLERVTVFGSIFCDVLTASESLLNDIAIVNDQQSGCIRFTRFESGSALPRRYRCVPDGNQIAGCTGAIRCFAPLFKSRKFGRPDYAQLMTTCPDVILTAGEDHGEVGVFAGTQNTIRLKNLMIKLQEFMPVGLSPVIVAES